MHSGSRRCAALRVAALTIVALSAAAAASAGDAFFRGGLIFQPRDIGIEGRWRLSFGSDYAANFSETIFVGFEMQTSVFRQDVPNADASATIVPGNGFVNVKVKSASLSVRPYGGGGVGLVSDFIFVGGGTEWIRDGGFHLLGGVELGRFSVELQLQRIFEEGADTTWTAYAGFVW